jgi:hypothetical protein
MSSLLTSTASNFEAEVIVGRLQDAGIAASINGVGLNVRGTYRAGGYDVRVEDAELARAREVLAQAQDVDDDELAALAEQAGREQGVAQD